MTIQGRALCPDGIPVTTGRIIVFTTQPPYTGGKAITSPLDEDGYFTAEVPIGDSFWTQYVPTNEPEGTLAFDDKANINGLVAPYQVWSVESLPISEPLEIRLLKGTQVRVTVRYDDDTIPPPMLVIFTMYPFGREGFDENSGKNVNRIYINHYRVMDENGECSILLAPGEYIASAIGNLVPDYEKYEKTFTVEEGEEPRINLRMPNPTRVKIALPTGEKPRKAILFNDAPEWSGGTRTGDEEGNVAPYFFPGRNFIYVRTEDNKFGLVRFMEKAVIERQTASKPLELTLQPTYSVKLRILNSATNQPITDADVAFGAHNPSDSHRFDGFFGLKTDAQGYVEIMPLIAGVKYSLQVLKENPAVEGEQTTWSVYSHTRLDFTSGRLRPERVENRKASIRIQYGATRLAR